MADGSRLSLLHEAKRKHIHYHFMTIILGGRVSQLRIKKREDFA